MLIRLGAGCRLPKDRQRKTKRQGQDEWLHFHESSFVCPDRNSAAQGLTKSGLISWMAPRVIMWSPLPSNQGNPEPECVEPPALEGRQANRYFEIFTRTCSGMRFRISSGSRSCTRRAPIFATSTITTGAGVATATISQISADNENPTSEMSSKMNVCRGSKCRMTANASKNKNAENVARD